MPTSQEKLVDALHEYNAAMRWGVVDRAVEHVPEERRADLLAQRDEFGEVQVTGCEVGQVTFQGKDRALAIVRLEWYLASALQLRTSYVQQSWQLKGGKWQIMAQRLVRGDPCPLITGQPEDRRPGQREAWPRVSVAPRGARTRN